MKNTTHPDREPDSNGHKRPFADRAYKDALRFVICGDSGDGKSTLLGNFLREYPGEESESKSTLQVTGEQEFAIGEGYTYFATPKRQFISSSTSRHESYALSMTTGVCMFDFAILLVDALKDVQTRTHHHCCILEMLGIDKVALAVNKMDLVHFSWERFDEIAGEFKKFTEPLGFSDVTAIPVAASNGDNILTPSENMTWFQGPTLLAHLETVQVSSDSNSRPLRLHVQSVNASESHSREVMGTLTTGVLRSGDEVSILPAAKNAVVERITANDSALEEAHAGDAVSVSLAGEAECASGDLLCATDDLAEISDQIAANVIWMDETPMLPGRNYLLKTVNQTAIASISTLKHKLNVDNLEHQAAKTLELNDIGYCNLALDRPLVFDPFSRNRETGSFILLDRLTNATAGAGVIEFGLRRATNIQWQELDIDKNVRADLKAQKPCALWFTGLSGSGKSTVASLLEKQLHALGHHTYVLDGDNVRHGLNKDLGFTDADRVENIRRVAETAKLFVDAGLIVLVSFISPFRSERRMARGLFLETEFLEVFVDAPLEVCEQRDPKGLYKKARAGKIKNFTGIDSAYEEPERADIRLETGKRSPDELVSDLIANLKKKGFI